MSTNNEMDDYELFGGEPPAQGPQTVRQYPTGQGAGAAPEAGPSQGSRSTLADTAAAVARRKKESERTALMHEAMLIVGFIVVLAAGWLIWNAYNEKQKERERQRHEYEMQEQAAQAERAKQQREEELARREKIQKEKEAKAEALKKEREAQKAAEAAKREAQAKAAKASQRFKSLLAAFRGAEIDYYKNAMDAERPDKVGAEALFVCLMPGGGSGCDLYEIRTQADAPMQAVKLNEHGDPDPMEETAFAEKLKSAPSLILRDRGGLDANARTDVKAYFLDPTRAKRGLRGATNTCPAPTSDGVFSPSKEDFGALYDAARALGCTKMAFKYKVSFKGGGLADPVPVKDMGFGEELGRSAFRDAVRRSLEAKARGRRVTDADVEGVLRAGQVVFTSAR